MMSGFAFVGFLGALKEGGFAPAVGGGRKVGHRCCSDDVVRERPRGEGLQRSLRGGICIVCLIRVGGV